MDITTPTYRLGQAWLALGLFAFISANILAIILIICRTPLIGSAFPTDVFQTALVLHVDSVTLVWFASVAGIMFSLAANNERMLFVGWAAFALCLAGTLGLMISPGIHPLQPVLSNYIPVLNSPFFLLALLLFAAGVLLLLLRFLATVGWPSQNYSTIVFALYGAALSAIMALVTILLSYWKITAVQPNVFFESLFWGGGHVFQQSYVFLMLVAWFGLQNSPKNATQIPIKWLKPWLILACIPSIIAPFIVLLYEPGTFENRESFTHLMIVGGWIAVPAASILVIMNLFKQKLLGNAHTHSCDTTVVISLLLFWSGIIAGFFIDDNSLQITAHYHGTMGGINIAFMGWIYRYLPLVGFHHPNLALIKWQAYTYGTGLMLLMIGLIWSSQYGIPRKTGGSDQILAPGLETLAMTIMSSGGTIALFASFLFVYIVINTIWKNDFVRRNSEAICRAQ